MTKLPHTGFAIFIQKLFLIILKGHQHITTNKNSIRDAHTPYPEKLVFKTMRQRKSETVTVQISRDFIANDVSHVKVQIMLVEKRTFIVNFLHLTVSEIQPGQDFKVQVLYSKGKRSNQGNTTTLYTQTSN